MKAVNNSLRIICLLFFTYVFYILMKKTTNNFSGFLKLTDCFISILFFILIVFFIKKKYKISLVLYLLMLVIFMTFRKKVDLSYNFNIYLDKWLKIITTSKIVFFSIFGNILLFQPLAFLLLLITKKYFKSIIITILIIVFLEIIQLIFSVGVFDIVDIILNIFGVLLITFVFKMISILFERKKKNDINI